MILLQSLIFFHRFYIFCSKKQAQARQCLEKRKCVNYKLVRIQQDCVRVKVGSVKVKIWWKLWKRVDTVLKYRGNSGSWCEIVWIWPTVYNVFFIEIATCTALCKWTWNVQILRVILAGIVYVFINLHLQSVGERCWVRTF